ncbi:hypothetical protein BH20ACT13_BH20ACT13_19200 [soil metagenome]
MQRLLLVAIVAVAVLSGCGGDDETTPTETMTVKAYFLRDGHVWPVTREVEATDDNLTAAQTPAILVEAPLAFEEVTSPLRATGTANTFEANFQYELTDSGGAVIAENFVTATSGTGTRGTFEFTVPFDYDGEGTLIVFESSAKDGSRINIAEIPLSFGS